MRRLFVILSGLLMINFGSLKADEGMWLLPLIEEINYSSMSELGVELKAEDIYNINNSSIKDAIVIFGEGCTGEIVSEEGLLFTNHHCGFDYIQDLSSVEKDYLKDGFWAKSQSEELPNPGLEVRFLERIEDVTDSILTRLPDSLSNQERRDKLENIITSIEAETGLEGKFEAEVAPFYAGNKYYLFVYTVFKDVRLVGTPPSSIGKFGYDTDNWEWPRHTGDFSIFRVYTAPDGSPAEYSEQNIPLKPRYFLPVSLKGINNGEMTLILGYPGNTNRFLNSSGVREIREIVNENRIKVRTVRQNILIKDMRSDPKIQIQYADKYSNSSNYWKYSIGQNRQLDALNIVEKREQEEKLFQEWVDADSVRKSLYGNTLSEINDYYRNKRANELNFNTLGETFFESTELIGFIMNFQLLNMYLLMGDTESEEAKQEIDLLKKETEKFFKDYNSETDIKVASTMFSLYKELVPSEQWPDIYTTTINKKYKGNINKFVERLYSKTFFLDKEKILEFLDKPSFMTLYKDFGFKVTSSIFSKYFEEYSVLNSYKTELNELERLYMRARMEMYPDSSFYSDANFTMRFSYGKVCDYSPGDAVHYDEFTTLKGVMEKEDKYNVEFLVPDKLKQLFAAQDYGIYGKNNTMPVCFITDNDITGGSSGSPVLNARGELIGLAFDGNWEAMSSDISYEPELQRCICVDIRYVLFIIDKFADSSYLIDELKIIP